MVSKRSRIHNLSSVIKHVIERALTGHGVSVTEEQVLAAALEIKSGKYPEFGKGKAHKTAQFSTYHFVHIGKHLLPVVFDPKDHIIVTVLPDYIKTPEDHEKWMALSNKERSSIKQEAAVRHGFTPRDKMPYQITVLGKRKLSDGSFEEYEKPFFGSLHKFKARKVYLTIVGIERDVKVYFNEGLLTQEDVYTVLDVNPLIAQEMTKLREQLLKLWNLAFLDREEAGYLRDKEKEDSDAPPKPPGNWGQGVGYRI